MRVSYDSTRNWCIKFGRKPGRRLECNYRVIGDIFFLDEVYVQIRSLRADKWYPTTLSQARSRPGWQEVDVLPQTRRGGIAAKRFFRRIVRSNCGAPGVHTMDRLRDYCVVQREIFPEAFRETAQYTNDRAELSHQPAGVRERGMRLFKSQIFLSIHAEVHNLFNRGKGRTLSKSQGSCDRRAG